MLLKDVIIIGWWTMLKDDVMKRRETDVCNSQNAGEAILFKWRLTDMWELVHNDIQVMFGYNTYVFEMTSKQS